MNTLILGPYWPTLVRYYYDSEIQHRHKDNITSIWDWLEEDYSAFRYRDRPGREIEMRFDREEDLVAFKLLFERTYCVVRHNP